MIDVIGGIKKKENNNNNNRKIVHSKCESFNGLISFYPITLLSLLCLVPPQCLSTFATVAGTTSDFILAL